jgi:hypothetical protein
MSLGLGCNGTLYTCARGDSVLVSFIVRLFGCSIDRVVEGGAAPRRIHFGVVELAPKPV